MYVEYHFARAESENRVWVSGTAARVDRCLRYFQTGAVSARVKITLFSNRRGVSALVQLP